MGRGAQDEDERDWSGAGVGWAHAVKDTMLNNPAVHRFSWH